MNKRNESHCKKILAHLKTHEFITNDDAIELYHCYRLSARIFDLRSKYGVNIDTDMVYSTDDDGYPMKYGKYRLVV